MDIKKLTLYVALVVVGLILWNTWEREHASSVPLSDRTVSSQSENSTQTSNTNVPIVSANKQENTTQPSTISIASQDRVTVKTDVLNIDIDKHGGNIIQAGLPKYPQNVDTPHQSFVLLNSDQSSYYVAQSGLTGNQGPDTQSGQVSYTTDANSYTLEPNQDQLKVTLKWQGSNGLQVEKIYTFYRNQYVVGLQYRINNASKETWNGYLYLQLARTQPVNQGSFLTHLTSGLAFTGAAISSPETHYKKLNFSELAVSPLNQMITGGWGAMVQHYFLSAWIPNNKEPFHYYSHGSREGIYTLGMIGPQLTVNPGQIVTTEARLYSGPAEGDQLKKIAPHLDMTVDYGWLWFISVLLFWVMKHVYEFIGNWGWSIVVVTLLIKLAFYQLSAKSYRSMAHMRRLQPKMEQLRQRHGEDRQAFSKAMMELYREEKCNPLSGCLPILVQIPFFIAFYYMIVASVELRQAPFLLWIHDLSLPDPYYILPVVMGLTMFIQQKLNPPAPDPVQQKVMMFLPLIFTVFFLQFPAGLVIYWITNNVLSIVQQWYIINRVNKIESSQETTQRRYKQKKS